MKGIRRYGSIIMFMGLILNHLFAQAGNPVILTEAEKAWLDEGHTVKVRVADWPPYQFDDNGFKGISVDYIKKIFDRHGISYEFVSGEDVPWPRALEMIRDHEGIDLILTAKVTEERKADMVFTDEYLSLPWVIFNRIDSPYIGGLQDLRGKTVSVQDGFVMTDLLKSDYPEINLSIISGSDATEKCLEVLAEGEVDGYIGNLSVGSYIIMNRGLSNIKVAAPTPFGNHNQAMAVRSDWEELAGIINKTLASFTPEEHSEIRNAWLSIRFEHGLRPIDIIKWVLLVSALFLVLFLYFYLWNRKLKREIQARRTAESKLQSSENRYRSLADAAFEGLLIVGDGIILDANKKAEELFGYSAKDLNGRDVSELVSPGNVDRIRAESREGQTSHEAEGMKNGGLSFPIGIQEKSFSFEGRSVYVVAITDLTEKKKASEKIRSLQGILPICSRCKQIRDDQGYWNILEEYIRKNSMADFTHSLCPKCAKELYPDFVSKDEEV